MLTKMTDHRIFGPENDGSNLFLMHKQLNLLQVKLSPREGFTVNPRKIPTFKSW